VRIGLLECDHVGRKYRGIAGDYFDMFAVIFDRFAPKVELVPFDVVGGVLPDAVDTCQGYVCTGSRYSAYDDYPWIRQLVGFVREVQTASVPFVGICFGHQILAQALGGRVAKAASGWGAGAHILDVDTTAAAVPWMVPAQDACNLLFMHQDQVVDLPRGATLLGSAEHCPVAMFEVGAGLLGVQAHPEFTPDFAAALIHDRSTLITEAVSERALASLGKPTDEAVVTAWMGRLLAG
jgi:GMP synthase-like glutamine amidotransferase